jgi:hypothetical protein
MFGHQACKLGADVLLEPLVPDLDVAEHVDQLFFQACQRRLVVVEGEIVVNRLPGFSQNQIELVDGLVLFIDREFISDPVLRARFAVAGA